MVSKREIEARFAGILSQVGVDWGKDVTQLIAELSVQRQLGGSVGVVKGMELFCSRLQAAVDQSLSEIAANISSRGRRWRWAHAELERQMMSKFEEVPEQNIRMTWRARGNPPPQLVRRQYDAGMAAARGAISLHMRGWTGPRREPWHKRHRFWLQVAGGLLLYLAGLYTADVRTLIDVAFGHHPAGASSSPNPSLPAP